MSSRLIEDIAASFAESIGHVLVSALRSDLLFAYVIVEAVFFGFVWVFWKRTSHQTAPVYRDQAADWSKIYPIFLADAESQNVKASDLFLAWLREWMSLESDSDVHIDDARVFLSWAFDQTPPSDRKPGALTSRIISDIQAAGAELKEGSGGKARHDYYNLRSRVPCSHWLLVAYMSMYLLELIVFAFLHLMGFRRHRHGRLRYWARGLDSSEPMNVFLHGMGMGFTLYLGLIRAMGKAPLLMIELPWVSLDLRNFFQQIRPTREAFLDDYRGIMQKHNITAAVHVAHSYGNGVLSHILQDTFGKSVVSRCVFIDPVQLHSFRPTAHHFFYRWLCPVMDAPMSITMHRHSFWYDDMLVASMLPEDSLVIVGSRDPMIDFDALRRDIEAEANKRLRLQFLLLPGLTHIEALINFKARALISAAISEVIAAQAKDPRRPGFSVIPAAL